MPRRGWPDSQQPMDRGLMSLLGQQRSAVVGPLTVHLDRTHSVWRLQLFGTFAKNIIFNKQKAFTAFTQEEDVLY